MHAKLLVLPSLAALAVAAATGCQGGSGEVRPSLSARPTLTASPTVSLPSATRSLTATPSASRSGISRPSTDGPTAEPTTAEPTSEQPTTAEATTAGPTSQRPTTAEATTAEPTSQQPTTAEATTAEPTSQQPTTAETTPPPTTQAAESDGGTTSLWPLLVALAALAALVGVIVAVRRRSARRDWTDSLEGARAEAERLARDLAPSLLAGTREGRRGGWEVARPRVVALEDRLTALARTARGEADSTVASGLAAAVGDVRATLDEESRASDERRPAALQAARDATQRLAERVTVPASPSSPGST